MLSTALPSAKPIGSKPNSNEIGANNATQKRFRSASLQHRPAATPCQLPVMDAIFAAWHTDGHTDEANHHPPRERSSAVELERGRASRARRRWLRALSPRRYGGPADQGGDVRLRPAQDVQLADARGVRGLLDRLAHAHHPVPDV